MKKYDDIIKYLTDVGSHITFDYNNQSCGIDPLGTKFDTWYGQKITTFDTIDDLEKSPFFDGKTLREIASDVDFDY